MHIYMEEVGNPSNNMEVTNANVMVAGDVLLKARDAWLKGQINIYVEGTKLTRPEGV